MIERWTREDQEGDDGRLRRLDKRTGTRWQQEAGSLARKALARRTHLGRRKKWVDALVGCAQGPATPSNTLGPLLPVGHAARHMGPTLPPTPAEHTCRRGACQTCDQLFIPILQLTLSPQLIHPSN